MAITVSTDHLNIEEVSSDERFLPHLVLSPTFTFIARYLSPGKNSSISIIEMNKWSLLKFVPSVSVTDTSCGVWVTLSFLPKGTEKPAFPHSVS